jgi:hypothetical protein
MLENVGRLRSKIWRQKNWLLHQDDTSLLTSFFTREFFTESSMTVILHPPHYSVSQIEDFNTIQVIEAESQAVLNILTEHKFQDAF